MPFWLGKPPPDRARPVADQRLGLLSDIRTGSGCRSRGAVEMGCGQREHGALASRSLVDCPRSEFALGRTISQPSATASYPADFRRRSRRFLPSIIALLHARPGLIAGPPDPLPSHRAVGPAQRARRRRPRVPFGLAQLRGLVPWPRTARRRSRHAGDVRRMSVQSRKCTLGRI
jgi:hypothetical protein